MSLAYDASETHISKYDDLLARAVARLPSAAPYLRQEIYERARAALRKQLRDIQPTISDVEIVKEERALNEAIDRIEASANDGRAPSVAPTASQAPDGARGGWLSELLKRASHEAPAPLLRDPKRPSPPPASAMDFAPNRMGIERPSSAPRSLLPFSSVREAGRGAAPGSEPRQTKPVSRRDDLNTILHKFQEESPGVEASALISESGSMIASALAANVEEARVAGMAATLQNIGARAATALARGKPREVIIRGKNGYAILMGAGSGALLLALANETSSLGLIFFNMREAVGALPNSLEPHASGSERFPRLVPVSQT